MSGEKISNFYPFEDFSFFLPLAKPYEPPPREEFVKDGIKTVIEYKLTDEGKTKVKIDESFLELYSIL